MIPGQFVKKRIFISEMDSVVKLICFYTNINSWVCLLQSRSIVLQTVFQKISEKILFCDRALLTFEMHNNRCEYFV